MIFPQCCIFIFIFFKFGSINTFVTDNDSIWILQNVLQMKSWRYDSYGNLSLREIFVNGQITTLQKILNNHPIVNENNVDKISSALYMTLECEFSITLIKLLKTTNESNVSLEEINVIVLKMISMFLDLIDIAPNVVSHEPGFLSTSLSINLHINKIIHFITNPKLDKNEKTNDYFLDRKFWHMINTTERFVIPNCPLDDSFEDEMFHGKKSDYEPRKLIKNMNDSLESAGLKTTTILELGTNTNRKHNESFITIIILVLKQLNSIIKIEKSIFNQINAIGNDFSDILSYMHLIFDSIMQILYEQTIDTLETIKTLIQREKIKKLKKLVKKWIKNDLIHIYKQLILKSNLLQFPMYFTVHLKFILRTINDMIYYKEIRNLNVLNNQIKEYLINLQDKYHQGLKLLPIKDDSEYYLWEIIQKIVSIEEFKNFNLVFKLHQNYGPIKYDSTELNLNTMQYIIEEKNDKIQICEIMQSLYLHCFNIKIIITKLKTDPSIATELTESFSKFLEAIKDIDRSVSLKNVNENFKTILPLLSQYLENNKVNFTIDEIRLKKVLYFTMNLIDKYQIHSCETIVHRSALYATYKQNPEIKMPDLEYLKTKHTDEKSENVYPVQPLLDSVNENIEEKQTFAMLQKNYMDRFYNPNYKTPLFYWKGELQPFIFIFDDVINNNVFDFLLFTKYVNAFHKWIVSVLFYTMIDVLKYFLKEKHVYKNNKLFTAYVQNLQNINFPTYLLPVINTMVKAKHFDEPIDIIGFQIFLEDHVKQYSVIKQTTRYETTSFDLGQLNELFEKLLEKYDDVYINSRPIYDVHSEIFKNRIKDENNENTELKKSDYVDTNNSNVSKLPKSCGTSENNSDNSKLGKSESLGNKTKKILKKLTSWRKNST